MNKEKDYKSLYESADAVITFISKRMYKLEQENERLREYVNANPLFSDSWNNRLRADKYKSALEEIREIAELPYYSKGMPEEPLSQRDFILDAINNYEQRRIKILTKINEVLE